MKKFNKTTQIEMSVDAIADMFLSIVDTGFCNREQFIEAVIGTSLEKGTLGTVFSSYMGALPSCELPVNSTVYCNYTIWDYHTESAIEHSNSESREIGVCTIVDVNAYSKECYKVQFTRTKSSGKIYTDTVWVPAHTVTVAEIMM
jgi:hypothetical protein